MPRSHLVIASTGLPMTKAFLPTHWQTECKANHRLMLMLAPEGPRQVPGSLSCGKAISSCTSPPVKLKSRTSCHWGNLQAKLAFEKFWGRPSSAMYTAVEPLFAGHCASAATTRPTKLTRGDSPAGSTGSEGPGAKPTACKVPGAGAPWKDQLEASAPSLLTQVDDKLSRLSTWVAPKSGNLSRQRADKTKAALIAAGPAPAEAYRSQILLTSILLSFLVQVEQKQQLRKALQRPQRSFRGPLCSTEDAGRRLCVFTEGAQLDRVCHGGRRSLL